jgi:hypothetical protein
MCPGAQRVSFTRGAMIAAATPLLAVSILAWVMIVLPIVLVVGVGVAYLLGRRRSSADIERVERASSSDAQGPTGPTGRSPGA